jgi:hypothetical protein
MKRTKTMSLGLVALSALLHAPSAWAQAGGAGGEAGETAAAGAAGDVSTPGAAGTPAEPAAGAPSTPGAAGAEAGEAGGGNEGGGAGAPPKPEIPPPNEYDLLENDGGKACSIGGPGSTPGVITLVLGAALGASLLRGRKRG